ncbi:MAG: hypothetical protein WC413_04515 [Candidatus Nanoarchaeia archaeon]
MKSKKGAIELSMTTIIVIILGVTLLSLGLMFIRGMFDKINDITKQTFESADEQIRAYMTTGTTKMYILGSNTVMQPKTSQRMYVGIKNILGRDDEFYLKVKSADGKSDPKWIEVPTVSQPIEAGAYATIVVNVKVPKNAIPGETYMYSLETYAKSQSNMYYSQTLTVTIE